MSKFLFYDDKIINILRKEEKPSGGAAVQAYGWIMGLQDLGHDVSVMTRTCTPDQIKDECRQLQLIPLYDRKKGVRWLRWIYYRLPFIYHQIKRAKPDYLYQGVPGWNSFVLALICRQLKIKFILRISNDFLVDERFFQRYGKTHRYFQQQGLNMSYCILCQNDYQYSILRNQFPSKKVFKIPNPVIFSGSGSDKNIPGEYIAWLGLFQYQKNLRLLFEISSALKEENFLVAGKEEESCDDETRFYLKKLQELPNVSFAGFLRRGEVLPFLANAKYLLNTSHYEGFSNTFLESMYAGTPIITSMKVNPDSIISKNRLGIVYDSVDNLVAKLRNTNLAEYTEWSANVKNYVHDQHDYRVLSNKFLGLLNGSVAA